MSSTRNPIRTGADHYPTPAWAVKSIIPVLHRLFPGGVRRAIEPAAGNGAIIAALEGQSPHIRHWHAIDIRMECQDPLGEVPTDSESLIYDIENFLDKPVPDQPYDLVITNPPYNMALEFVQRSLEWVHENGWVVMLLRLPFLAGQKRGLWMRNHMPDVYVLPKRPSFTGHGTDSCDYAWMSWQRRLRTSSRVEILEVLP